MTIPVHAEDVAIYADQLHRDLVRIAAALEKTAELLEGITSEDGSLRVSQEGSWSVVAYTATP